MYELDSENLTGLGGPMGTERTWSNFRKFFTTITAAKRFAENDYKKRKGYTQRQIEWAKDRKEIRSQDLGFVMYHIRKIVVTK